MEIRAYAQESRRPSRARSAWSRARTSRPWLRCGRLCGLAPTKSLEDVDAECARGAQFATSSNVALQCRLGAVVDVDTFKTKLHVGLVKRADNFDLKALLKFRAPPEQSGGDAAPAEA